jgi:hypothetical protein
MSFIQSFPLDKPKDSLDAILKRLKNGALLDQECALYFKERFPWSDSGQQLNSNMQPIWKNYPNDK